MTQATEMELRAILEDYLKLHKLYEIVYIKIIDDRVIIENTIEDLNR